MNAPVSSTVTGGCVRVYLAGKVSKVNWRDQILETRGPQGDDSWRENEFEFRVGGISLPLIYTGPFFTSCDHGCGHMGTGAHGNSAPGGSCYAGLHFAPHGTPDNQGAPLKPIVRQHVHAQCTAAIYNSDLVLAWVDDLTCYGTIWELAHAQTIGVPTVVAMPRKMGQRAADELWFTLQRAHFIWAESPVEALKVAIEPFDRMRDSEWRRRCESPIERRLLDAVLLDGRFRFSGDGWAWDMVNLRPQVNVGSYRLDFAITGPGVKLALECDGHDFHERTKEQAARDRSRDRELTLDGWTVLRFTGSEIHKNVAMCAEQVFEAILRQTEVAQ